MAINVGGNKGSGTIAPDVIEDLQKNMVGTEQQVQQQEQPVSPPVGAPGPDMSDVVLGSDSLESKLETEDRQAIREGDSFQDFEMNEVTKEPEPKSVINIDRDYENNLIASRLEEAATRWDAFAGRHQGYNQYGDMPSLEDRADKFVTKFRDGELGVNTRPTPDSPNAPKFVIGDTFKEIGATDANNALDENFLTIASLVTENAVANASFMDTEETEKDIRAMYEPKKKEIDMFQTPVDSGSLFSKVGLAKKVGYDIAKEYKRYKTQSLESSADITPIQAATLGSAAIELYAAANPDVIEVPDTEGMSTVNKSKLKNQIGYFKITERGSELLNADMKKRQALFPSQLLRPRKIPTSMKIGEEITPGTKNITGKVGVRDMKYLGNPDVINEAIKNLGSIGHVVNIRRGKIALLTTLPALRDNATGSNGESSVSSNINKVGNKKLNDIKAKLTSDYRKDGEDLNDPGVRSEIERVARTRLNNNKNILANQLFGVATERRGANYLDYYVMTFNYRMAPLQTLFDPTNMKLVRFVTTGAKPVEIRIGSRYEKALRQMYAMSLVEGADMKLPKERDRLLRENHDILYEDGVLLREILKGMDNNMYDEVMQAVERGDPLESDIFKSIKGLGLNPDNPSHARILNNIESKGEDGNAYIDGLIDYANYYDALYYPETKTGSFKTFFNAYMDGKTNGLASAAMILGITHLAYRTGVLRDSSTDLLDAGDIRVDVADRFSDIIDSQSFGLFSTPELSEAMKYVAKEINKVKQLHKDTTMTFGYGIDPAAFSLYIDDTINNILAEDKDPTFRSSVALLEANEDISEAKGMGSGIANMLNDKYTQAVVNSLSPEMIESRNLMGAVGGFFGLTDDLFTIKDPLGNPQYLGNYRPMTYEDAEKANFTYRKDGKPVRTKGVSYGKGRLTSAGSKSIGGRPGDAAMKSAAVAVMQGVDAATIISLYSGLTWDKIMKETNGNPFLHPIYDAIKVDAASYDVVLREINKNWAEITMNYNHINQARVSLSNLMTNVKNTVAEMKENESVLDTTEGSKYEMIGMFSKKHIDKFGNVSYPFLAKFIKQTGVVDYNIRNGVYYRSKNPENWMSRQVMIDSGIPDNTKEITPEQFERFIKSLAKITKLESRLAKLELKINNNKKDMYNKIAKNVDGKWIVTVDDIFQYYAH